MKTILVTIIIVTGQEEVWFASVEVGILVNGSVLIKERKGERSWKWRGQVESLLQYLRL